MKTYDLAVIGSGPAGMTAALYAARAGLSTIIFEQLMAGGQMGETGKIDNYPGFPDGIGGFDLAFAMQQQEERFGAVNVNEEVVAIDADSNPKVITTTEGQYAARSIVVATGARSRKMGIEGEESLMGRGISYCATCDGNFFKGKPVIVVGGGNTAAADAVYLSRICPVVYVVHRRDTLRATAASRHQMEAAENIEFVWDSLVDELLEEDGKLSGAIVKNKKTGERRTLEAPGLFVAVGKTPNTEAFKGSLPLDDDGYVIADETGATSMPGVFAAGDVRQKRLRQVATAISDGANAAEAAAESLVS